MQYRKLTLSEDLTDISEEDIGVSQTPVYADAVRKMKSRREYVDKILKDHSKNIENIDSEHKIPEIAKKLHLAESNKKYKKRDINDNSYVDLFDEIYSQLTIPGAGVGKLSKNKSPYDVYNIGTTYSDDYPDYTGIRIYGETWKTIKDDKGKNQKIKQPVDLTYAKELADKYSLITTEYANSIILWIPDTDIDLDIDKKPLKESIYIESVKNFKSTTEKGKQVMYLISTESKLDQFDSLISELYPEGITDDTLEDLLTYESDWILTMLDIDKNKMIDMEK